MTDLTLSQPYSRTFDMKLTDHFTPALGKTVSVQLSKAGAAFAGAAGIVSEVGVGSYKIVLTAADTNTVGDLEYYCTASGCDATKFVDQVKSGTSATSISFSQSAVSICSQALTMLGDNPIAALDDSTDRGLKCATLYPLVRNYALVGHPWNCCRARVQINPDATAPVFGYAVSYTLPADFGRIIAVGEEGNETDQFTIESTASGGQKLLMNAGPTDALNLRYIRLNTDELQWPPTLVRCMVEGMRVALAYGTTEAQSLEQMIVQAMQPLFREARAVDGQNVPAEMWGDQRLLASRFSSLQALP